MDSGAFHGLGSGLWFTLAAFGMAYLGVRIAWRRWIS